MTRTQFSLIATAGALALGGAIALAASSCAAETLQLRDGYSHDPSKVVTYTRIDLSKADLNTAAGARAMLQQIQVAADAVCGGQVHAQVAPKDYNACLSDAVDGAVRTLGARTVKTALVESRREQRQMLAAK